MKPDVLKMRSFDFPPPKGGGCDLLVIAGEHSGDEQAARMVAGALAEKPGLRSAGRSSPPAARSRSST